MIYLQLLNLMGLSLRSSYLIQYHIFHIPPFHKVLQFILGIIYGELQWVFWLCHRCRCSGLLDAGKWSNSRTLSWGCIHWWRCKYYPFVIFLQFKLLSVYLDKMTRCSYLVMKKKVILDFSIKCSLSCCLALFFMSSNFMV